MQTAQIATKQANMNTLAVSALAQVTLRKNRRWSTPVIAINTMLHRIAFFRPLDNVLSFSIGYS